jgi:hypothetical protein
MNMAFTPYKVMSMIRRDPVWPAARRAARVWALMGLPPWGPGSPIGPDVKGGACLWKGQLFGAGFLKEVAVHHYY